MNNLVFVKSFLFYENMNKISQKYGKKEKDGTIAHTHKINKFLLEKYIFLKI